MTWELATEALDTVDATSLRRDYYDEVASRYWRRRATSEEIDQGLDDGVELLRPPTGQFVVGRFDGEGRSAAARISVGPTDQTALSLVAVLSDTWVARDREVGVRGQRRSGVRMPSRAMPWWSVRAVMSHRNRRFSTWAGVSALRTGHLS